MSTSHQLRRWQETQGCSARPRPGCTAQGHPGGRARPRPSLQPSPSVACPWTPPFWLQRQVQGIQAGQKEPWDGERGGVGSRAGPHPSPAKARPLEMHLPTGCAMRRTHAPGLSPTTAPGESHVPGGRDTYLHNLALRPLGWGLHTPHGSLTD